MNQCDPGGVATNEETLGAPPAAAVEVGGTKVSLASVGFTFFAVGCFKLSAPLLMAALRFLV